MTKKRKDGYDWMNFDDINFESLSDAERKEVLQLWHDDRYAFYSRWDNPAEVQDKMIQWQRETLPGYTERPVDWVFSVIGEMKTAGAPKSVLTYYMAAFAESDKYNHCVPNPDVMPGIDKYFKEKYEDTNWDVEPVEYSNNGLTSPLHSKWCDIVQGVYDMNPHRVNVMRRYRKIGSLSEIIEERPEDYTHDVGVGRPCGAFSAVRFDGNQLVITYEFENAYILPDKPTKK